MKTQTKQAIAQGIVLTAAALIALGIGYFIGEAFWPQLPVLCATMAGWGLVVASAVGLRGLIIGLDWVLDNL